MFERLKKHFWDKEGRVRDSWAILMSFIEGNEDGAKKLKAPWYSIACYVADVWFAWQNFLGRYAFDLSLGVDNTRRAYFKNRNRFVLSVFVFLFSPLFLVATFLYNGWQTFWHFWIIQKNIYFENKQKSPYEKSLGFRRYVFGILGLPFAIVSAVLLFPFFIVYESYRAFIFIFKGLTAWCLHFEEGINDLIKTNVVIHVNGNVAGLLQGSLALLEALATPARGWSFKEDWDDFITGKSSPYRGRSRWRFLIGFLFALPGLLLGVAALLLPLMVAITIENIIGMGVGIVDIVIFFIAENKFSEEEITALNACRAFYVTRTRSILGLPGFLYGTALGFAILFVSAFLYAAFWGLWSVTTEFFWKMWIDNKFDITVQGVKNYWLETFPPFHPDYGSAFFAKLSFSLGFFVGAVVGTALSFYSLPFIFIAEMSRMYFVMCYELILGALEADVPHFTSARLKKDIMLDHISVRWLGHTARVIGVALSMMVLPISITILIFQEGYKVARLMVKSLFINLKAFLFDKPQLASALQGEIRPSLLRVLFGLPLGLPPAIIVAIVATPLVLITKLFQSAWKFVVMVDTFLFGDKPQPWPSSAGAQRGASDLALNGSSSAVVPAAIVPPASTPQSAPQSDQQPGL